MEIHFGVESFKKLQILGWWENECEGNKKPKITVLDRDREILTALLQLRYWEATIHYLVSQYVFGRLFVVF